MYAAVLLIAIPILSRYTIRIEVIIRAIPSIIYLTVINVADLRWLHQYKWPLLYESEESRGSRNKITIGIGFDDDVTTEIKS